MAERDVAILRSLAERIDPADAGAHNNLGVVFFQKGLVEDAVAAFERAMELDPRLEVARRNAQVALRESGTFETRVMQLREAVRADPDSAEIRDTLARTYLLGGDPGGAATEWTALLREYPESTPLYMKLAYAEAEQGRVQDAIHLLEEAALLSPDLPAIRLQLAELLHDSGMPVRAEREVRRALELDDTFARAHAFLASLLEGTGREEAAAESLERARQLDPNVVASEAHLSLDRYRSVQAAHTKREGGSGAVDVAPLAGLARAMELRRDGDLRGAAEELTRAIASGDDSADVRQALAEIRLLAGEPEAAADAYEALLAERSDSPKLWNERGVAVHRLGRFDEAVRAYRRTVALDHSYSLGWNNLGVALAQSGESGPAERALLKATSGEAPPEVLWNLGLFLSLTDRPDEAVDVYRRALDLDRGVAESWSRLGSALFQARQPEPARDALLEALERNPELAEARYQLGFALSALGDFKGALRETQRALQQVPVLPTPSYQLLIDVQFEEGSLPAPDAGEGERVAAGSPVADFDFEPGSLDAAFAGFVRPEPVEGTGGPVRDPLDTARAALRRGQLDRAAEAVRRAVAAVPGAVAPRLLEGQVLLQQGLAGEALERFEAVLASGVADIGEAREARVGRAQALLALDRFDAAISAAHSAEEAGGGAALVGRALLAGGRPRAAVEAFERAVDHGEVDAVTLTGYGSALLEAGRPADARRVFERSLAAGRSAAASVGLARSLEGLGDGAGALSAYRAAVSAVPSYDPAAMGLAELQWRSGDTREAIGSLAELLALDPTRVNALVRLGQWLGDLGRVDHATRSLERALRLDPEREDARRELTRLQTGGR